jgi:MOSC domain-containing protein YiiM
MSFASGSIVSVQVGTVAPLGPNGVPSGFIKRRTDGPVMAGRLGLAGDQQADRRVHGGRDKALYCYPGEHYTRWRSLAPQHAALLTAGGFGENLTTEGFDEDRVAIGDVFQIGSATVQVTQPRRPCFKLALRFGDPHVVRAMVRSGLSGWYLSVLDPGLIEAGAAIALLDRPNPQWSVARFNRLINERRGTVAQLAELAKLPGLARHWKQTARLWLGTAMPAHVEEIFSSKVPASVPADGLLSQHPQRK